MSSPPRSLTIVERAYDLARAGPCANVSDIRAQLKRERYDAVESHLSSPSLARSLRELCRDRLAKAMGA